METCTLWPIPFVMLIPVNSEYPGGAHGVKNIFRFSF